MSEHDPLAFDIAMGLKHGLALVRGMRRALNEHERALLADRIAEHLRRCGWRMEPGPPAPGAANLYRGASENREPPVEM